MSEHNNIEWAMASIKGVATVTIGAAIGWVDVSGYMKAGLLSVAATVGSFAAKKVLEYAFPRIKIFIKKLVIKIKNKKK